MDEQQNTGQNSNEQNQPEPQQKFTLPKNFQSSLTLAIISLVFGSMSFVLGFSFLGIIPGVIAIILASISIAKSKMFKGMCITAIVFSIVGIILGIAGLVFIQYKFNKMIDTNLESKITGQKVPDVNFTTLEGKNISLSELKGRKVILNFWATWCGPCRAEIPHFVKIAEKHDQNELMIIGISREDKNTLSDFAEDNSINYPLVSQSKLPEPFNNITSIPTTYFIEETGVITNVVTGSMTHKELKHQIKHMKAPEPQLVTSTE